MSQKSKTYAWAQKSENKAHFRPRSPNLYPNPEIDPKAENQAKSQTQSPKLSSKPPKWAQNESELKKANKSEPKAQYWAPT